MKTSSVKAAKGFNVEATKNLKSSVTYSTPGTKKAKVQAFASLDQSLRRKL